MQKSRKLPTLVPIAAFVAALAFGLTPSLAQNRGGGVGGVAAAAPDTATAPRMATAVIAMAVEATAAPRVSAPAAAASRCAASFMAWTRAPAIN